MKQYRTILIVFLVLVTKLLAQNNRLELITEIRYDDLCLSAVSCNDIAYFGNGFFLQIIDFSNPSLPVELSKFYMNDYIQDIVVKDTLAYVSSMWGLNIVNISDPSNPTLLGSTNTMGRVMRITVKNNYAYLALEWDGFQIIDVSDPQHPTELKNSSNEYAWWDTDHIVLDVAVKNSYAYIVDGMNGLRIIDIADPFRMQESGFYDMSGIARAVALYDNYAYVANSKRGISIIDITNPINPVEKNVFDTSGFVWDIVVAQSTAFVADNIGLRILDISNPISPTEISFLKTTGSARRVSIHSNLLSMANHWTGFRLINVANPYTPIKIGEVITGDEIQDVIVNNGKLYIAKGREGLSIIDMSDRYHPKNKGIFSNVDNLQGLAVRGDYAYLADDDMNGLQIIDISDSDNPSAIGNCDTPGNATDVVIKGNYAYIADGPEGLRIINIVTPSHPGEIGHYNTDGLAQAIAIAGYTIYLADGHAGLRIIDISNPNSPSEIGALDTQGEAVGIDIYKQYALVADGWNGLCIVDISNPSKPLEIGHIELQGYASNVLVDSKYVYLTDSNFGVFVIDMADPSHPTIKKTFNPLGYANTIAVEDQYIYLGASGYGLWVLANDLIIPSSPPFLTQQSGCFYLSVFANGVIGRDLNPISGDGCRYHTSGNALYSGSFMLGNSERIHGMIYNRGDEFTTMDSLQGFFSDSHFTEISHASFSDAGAKQPFGVLVKQHTYSGEYDDFIYYHYEIQNPSGIDLKDIYAALFLDWDIGDANSNKGGIHIDQGLAYQYEADIGRPLQDPFYYGVIALSGIAGACVTSSDEYKTQDSLYTWISQSDSSPNEIADCRMYIGSGPYDIPSNGSQDVYFCIIAAPNYNDLLSRSAYAIQRWREIFIYEPFLTHRNGALTLSVFGNGFIGRDQTTKTGDGCGFGTNVLDAGHFMLGNSDRIHGMIYSKQDEFGPVDSLRGFFSDSHFPEITHASFDDSGADQPFGVLVKQHTYGGRQDDCNYIHYEILNQSNTDLENMYAALFLDWGIGNSDYNAGEIDLNRGLAYQHEADVGLSLEHLFYYGAIALSGMSGARVTRSDDYKITDSLFSWISSCPDSFLKEIGDCRMYIGSGPYDIPVGATQDVYFSIIGARNHAEIFSRCDYAIQNYHQIFTPVEHQKGNHPIEFVLLQNYPNPFNSKTVIKYSIPYNSHVILKIYDIKGRDIDTPVNTFQNRGLHTLYYNTKQLPSGLYFYQLKIGDYFVDTKKMLLIR